MKHFVMMSYAQNMAKVNLASCPAAMDHRENAYGDMKTGSTIH